MSCPFCGNEYVMFWVGEPGVAARCRKCNAIGPTGAGTETEALILWNQRKGERLTRVEPLRRELEAPTLLDQFAMAALPSLIDAYNVDETDSVENQIADDAYAIAGAMMKRRAQ